MIYFIKAGDFMKIGYTKNDTIDKRVASLQTGCPYKIEPVLYIKGTIQDEKAHQDIHLEHHYRGEWYLYSGVRDHFLLHKGIDMDEIVAKNRQIDMLNKFHLRRAMYNTILRKEAKEKELEDARKLGLWNVELNDAF